MAFLLSGDLSLNSSGLVILDIDKGSPVHYECISAFQNDLERLYYNYTRYKVLLESWRDINYISYELQNRQMRFNYSAGSLLSLAENVGVWKLAIYEVMKYREDMTLLGFRAQDIKKYATNNSKADKDEMIAAVNGNHIKTIRKTIPEGSINDVADAYHLAKMTRDYILGKLSDEYKPTIEYKNGKLFSNIKSDS